MAWKNPAEITVANDGEVYVGDVGSTLPDDFSTLDPAFAGLGYATEDGVTLTVSPDVTEFRVWQSRQVVRRELNSQDLQAAFGLVQWNEDTVALAFGGGDITEDTPGVFRYDFPLPGDPLDERALIVDAQDGSKRIRVVIPRGNVVDPVETQFQRSEMALLPITFRALQPSDGSAIGYMLFNSDAFVAGS